MIAKILKPTEHFSGILYSELKVNEGKASFSGAFNFPFERDFTPPEAYLHYLDRLAACAQKSIKNRQFHAIISAKGKDHDKTFLTELAKKWMQKMGYGEQPYLVYFHDDTANNHVHIVSCRINKEGQRINPYMEGRRAGIAIRELMNENLKEKAAADIKDVLNYSFSTEAQFKLVLECRGWKIREKAEKINLIKMIRQHSVDRQAVLEKTAQYAQDKARINQLRAIFNKYKGLPTGQFQKLMRESFGVEVVFHMSKEHEKPYGYTVIDHANKMVMKGGEIMPLEALINPLDKEEHRKLAGDLIQSYLSTGNSMYSELKGVMYRNGYSMKKQEIFIIGDEAPLLSLTDDMYKQLRYYDRLNEANRFVVKSQTEANALSRFFFVRASNIPVHPEALRDDIPYREMILSFENDTEALRDYLNETQQVLFSHTNHTFLMDTRNHVLANVTGLGLECEVDLESYYSRNKKEIDSHMDVAPGLSVLATLFGLFGRQSSDEQESAPKRKRKRKI
ncbi:MAG: relaxase/mobilization nuclease domain-containing protein [Tannerella sp.]|jgi:hypothetical protein|nr:relaxase/mobilization nuclease domain-containing protein [Tannerella sp.]